MQHSDHLLRALSISIPMGIVFGLLAGFIRRRLVKSLSEKQASRWEQLKRAIFIIGIFMFAILAAYCFVAIDQPSFGYGYALMSVLNVVCLFRSFSRKLFDANGVPLRHHRVPKRFTPVVEVAIQNRARAAMVDS